MRGNTSDLLQSPSSSGRPSCARSRVYLVPPDKDNASSGVSHDSPKLLSPSNEGSGSVEEADPGLGGRFRTGP